MNEFDDKIAQLQTRLENLAKYEAGFKREIVAIRNEINSLKIKSQANPTKPASKERPPASGKSTSPGVRFPNASAKPSREPVRPPSFKTEQSRLPQLDKSNIEKFVGTYLISIIGVLVTVIGVGIGAKYAIDNNLISPLGRIVFGYLVGFGLIGFAVRLKAKYHTFSSVLLSGGMAIMYFVTYFAYSYYSLISQTTAFSLMVIFTVFTVISAIIYDRRVIAHIGLVGAYAVPFLLSDGSGRVVILFGYMTIVNIGILAISVQKYWKYLFYSSFVFTWLIYAVWYADKYSPDQHFTIGLIFLGLFFTIFYATFLAYKLVHKKPFNLENTALVILNSFVFFGFGHSILSDSNWNNFLGTFTVLNAITHFAVAALISKYKLGDRNAFYLVVALVLTFLTIAVPVQFDGNWITLLWIAEAAILFAIGRIKKIPLFEYFSYPLMIFAGVSLVNDWQAAYTDPPLQALTPLFNRAFLTSLSVAIALAVICYIDRSKQYKPQTDETLQQIAKYLIPTALIFVLYNTFRIEIGNYFYLGERQDSIASWRLFNVAWQIAYSIFFLAALSFVNIRWIRSTTLGFANLGLNALVIFVFLTAGLFVLSTIREGVLNPYDPSFLNRATDLFAARYFSFALLACLIVISSQHIRQEFLTRFIPEKYLRVGFDLGLCFTLLVVLSSELINYTDIFGLSESYKLGLSVFWGIYAVALIVFGIVYRKKHVRIFAICLFAITLIKLFFYDIASLDTISKTVVFVSIGILLLIASFLYNKYTKIIFDDETI